MITRMRKYELLLHESDYPAFLEALAALGVAHIQTIRNDLPAGAEFGLRQLKHLDELIGFLQSLSEPAEVQVPAVAPSPVAAHQLVHRIDELRNQLQELERQQEQLQTKKRHWAPWGELPVEELQQLREKGLHFHLFVCPRTAFNPHWRDELLLEQIWENERDLGFVIISELGDLSLPLPSGQQFVAEDLSYWAASWQHNAAEIRRIKQALWELRDALPVLEAERDAQTMALRQAHVEHHTEQAGGDRLRLLGLFVPAHKTEALNQLLAKSPILYQHQRPGPDDEVPVLLNNKRFSRLFHPIGDLFALPSYQELDLTPFFAPFFTLFFGMCLGDVGYGLLIVLAVLLARRKPAWAAYKRIFTLALILGSAAVGFGVLTGTFFGANLASVDWPWLQSWKLRFLNTDELFNLALILGLVQILFGMSLRMVNRVRMYGWVHGLSTLGWIIGILGGLLFAGGESLALGAKVLVGAGISLILFFNDPGKPLWKQFGKGLWDLYGITGLFGDVLSYIRLFALGLASGILGLVVNSIAFSVLDGPPVISWLFFVLILLVGHGLNFAISTLSAFVHPVRLTFVEFYKNAGFLGGGKEYDPYRKPNTKPSIFKTQPL
jgi:V/A-type H+/Na+-transporting ATPase subunit I